MFKSDTCACWSIWFSVPSGCFLLIACLLSPFCSLQLLLKNNGGCKASQKLACLGMCLKTLLKWVNPLSDHLLGVVFSLFQQRFDIVLRMEIADLHARKIITNYLKFYMEWNSEEEPSMSIQHTSTVFSKQEQRRKCHLKWQGEICL